MRKIGVLVGRETTFPTAFIERVNQMQVEDIRAEFCKLGGTRMDEPCEYRVIIDRISHEIPYYRAYVKNAVLQGTIAINNPFWWTADDKFFEASLASRQGIAVPKTVVLPNKSYVEGIVAESLRNLVYPLDWSAMVEYVGFPAYLKPAIGGGWKNVTKVHNMEELWRAYDRSGELLMILQENIEFEQYVRCICVGQTNILPIRYNPNAPNWQRYEQDANYLSHELGARIICDATTLCTSLGYDMNSVEFAIRGGVPYALDWLNPAPDMDVNSIGKSHFDWVLEQMANLTIGYAKRELRAPSDYRWSTFLNNGQSVFKKETGAKDIPAAIVPTGNQTSSAPLGAQPELEA